MRTWFTRRQLSKLTGSAAVIVSAGTLPAFAQTTSSTSSAAELSPDDRARETEQRMTDDERFSLIISLIGAVPSIGVPRDRRIPEGDNMSAGYTPGIPRLGVPALQSSDASMGVTNPGY